MSNLQSLEQRMDRIDYQVISDDKDKRIADLEAKLAESKNKHLLDEKEWQDYCSFKHIEPEIRGCLDREREYKQQLAMQENTITNLIEDNRASQEWYKKQLEEKDKENQELIKRYNELAEKEDNTFLNYEHSLGKIKKLEQDKIEFAIDCMERVSQEFSMRVGISDNNIDTLNDIMEEMVSILNGNK